MTPSDDYILLARRADGDWDWSRYAKNNEYLYGSDQGYENKDDAIEMAASRNPGIPIFQLDAEGRKLQIQ